jgi:hypothetical protein
MLNSLSGINGFGQGRGLVARGRAETCPMVVLNDDGHYLSSLQDSL